MHRKSWLALAGAIWLSWAGACWSASARHSWMWNVLVVPPPEGWDSEAGRSIRTVLSWHEAEISDSGTGAGGHDIEFVHIHELDENSALGVDLPIDDRTVAILSFASPEVDRALVQRLRGQTVPFLMAGGEDVFIDGGGRPIGNVFALDLYRDYRCSAFALYAAGTMRRDAHLALIASRFTVDQEREAKICYALLDDSGFMPLPFWVDASVSDAYGMVSQEIQSAADGALLTFIGNMAAREMWRAFMRVQTPWRIWNCAAPDRSYLSCRGMIFADQGLLLPEAGGLMALRRHLWNTRVMRISDLVAGGRAHALAEWVLRAIAALPQPVDALDRPTLLRALERTTGIPFGDQELDIVPELHRPSERRVWILEVRERGWSPLATLTVPGLPYVPYY